MHPCFSPDSEQVQKVAQLQTSRARLPDHSTQGDHDHQRRHRVQKAEENLSILDIGSYITSDGTTNDILSSTRHCIDASRNYFGTELDTFLSSSHPPAPQQSICTTNTPFTVVKRPLINYPPQPGQKS